MFTRPRVETWNKTLELERAAVGDVGALIALDTRTTPTNNIGETYRPNKNSSCVLEPKCQRGDACGVSDRGATVHAHTAHQNLTMPNCVPHTHT